MTAEQIKRLNAMMAVKSGDPRLDAMRDEVVKDVVRKNLNGG